MLGRLAYQAALTGEFEPALAALDAASADQEASGWQNVLRLQLWFASDVELRPPSIVSPPRSEATEVSGAITAFLQQRVAIARGVRPEKAAVATEAQHPEARFWCDLTLAWDGLCAGSILEATAALERASEVESTLALPELGIEVAIAKSMLAAMQGDDVDMVDEARKASDAARGTHFPQSQYAANLVLARARRRAGMPYLAARILSGLLKVAPAPWRPWLCWEQQLCKGTTTEPAPGFSACLATLCTAAREGDAAAWASGYAAARERMDGVAWLEEDLRSFIDLNDASRNPAELESEVVRTWAMGDSDAVPHGLFGMCEMPEAASGLVVATPGSGARRILASGAALAATHSSSVLAWDRRRARTDSVIAELLLQGSSDENLLFEKIYRFRYRPELHQNSRDVLYHRIRKRLGNLATLTRADGQVALELHGPLIVVDPRSSPPRDHYTVLAALASLGRGSIREVASKVGVSSRTVHDVLKALTDDGVCSSNMEGRERVFHLEDTTYSDPTRSGRFRGAPST